MKNPFKLKSSEVVPYVKNLYPQFNWGIYHEVDTIFSHLYVKRGEEGRGVKLSYFDLLSKRKLRKYSKMMAEDLRTNQQ